MTKATNGRLDQWGEILAEFFPATGSWSGTTTFIPQKVVKTSKNEKNAALAWPKDRLDCHQQKRGGIKLPYPLRCTGTRESISDRFLAAVWLSK